MRLSRPPQSEVMVKIAAKQAGLFETSATELYFNESNWNQSQFITLYKSGGAPINEQVTTGVTFNVNDELSSAEFSDQPPLTVAFETQIDKSKPLELKIDQDDQYIILTWERGVLQSSNDLKSNKWSDVLLFNIDGQHITCRHRDRKNKGTAIFRLTED